MKKKILLATANQHKIAEVLALTPGIPWLTINDFAELKGFNPVESGQSFVENAEIKAKAFAAKTGLITVAEDSGLEVEALNNEPGIYSARWVTGSDTDRNLALLARLAGNTTKRKARYVATLCVYNPETDQSNFFRGEVNGEIATEIRGQQGFGYDPIFVPVGYTQTFGELGETVKHQLSHRKAAFSKFVDWYQV